MRVGLPEVINTEEELEEVMTRPSDALIDAIQSFESPLVLLGAAGKMGPTLAIMAKRAASLAGKNLDVIAVSRFSDQTVLDKLQAHDIIPYRCDLMEFNQVRSLPDTSNIIYLVGMKFGTSDNPGKTWAFNTLIPAYVCMRYPDARIAALSTGNVYPLVRVDSGGADENSALTPLGEYANSCIARERIFQYFSSENDTPISLIRLNYAIDLRYGVLVDLALRIHEGKPIDVTMGHLNCIWQGDANEIILRAIRIAGVAPEKLNLTSQEIYSVRDIAMRLGGLMDRKVQIIGKEADTALLSNVTKAVELFGPPVVDLDRMLRWTAHWVDHVSIFLNKPTHFEVRDGKY